MCHRTLDIEEDDSFPIAEALPEPYFDLHFS